MNSNIRCSFSLSDNIGPGPAAYLPPIPKSGVAFSMLHRPVNKKGKNLFEFNIKTFRVVR